jgi:hypothetical protein
MIKESKAALSNRTLYIDVLVDMVITATGRNAFFSLNIFSPSSRSTCSLPNDLYEKP